MSGEPDRIESWPINRLVAYERNPRKNDGAVDRMCSSIREFGFKIPCLVRGGGEVVDGHLRLKAARKLGILEIPVILCDEWSPSQVKAFRIMVNQSVAWADWDEELLAQELQELQKFDYDLNLTGFGEDELAQLLALQEVEAGLTDEDAIPELPEVLISKVGDLFDLGDHKFFVGDATNESHVSTLMAGSMADAVFIDPPYNVDYAGYTEERLTMKGDQMSETDFKLFLESAFRSCRRIIKPGASLYCCHSSSWQREFQNALEVAGFEIRCQIIWAKNTFAWGFGRYKFQHEVIFYCHVAGQKDVWYGDKTQSTLWEENKPSANRVHPTAKPVELVERALVNSSKSGDIIVDLFGGSGSTLIGCQRTGRIARLMEVDPKYADCIIRRYQEYTGTDAILQGDGRTFNELAQARPKQSA